MIKLWEPDVRIIFYAINFALNRYKTCALSMSDTDKTTVYCQPEYLPAIG